MGRVECNGRGKLYSAGHGPFVRVASPGLARRALNRLPFDGGRGRGRRGGGRGGSGPAGFSGRPAAPPGGPPAGAAARPRSSETGAEFAGASLQHDILRRKTGLEISSPSCHTIGTMRFEV